MDTIQKATLTLAKASDGNPVTAVVVVMMFYMMFNFVEANVEKLIFGIRFEHFLDPFFALAFIAYSGYAVYCCAVFNGG